MEREKLHTMTHSITVPEHQEHTRLDAFLAQQKPEYSRTYFKDLAASGHIIINGKPATLLLKII